MGTLTVTIEDIESCEVMQRSMDRNFEGKTTVLGNHGYVVKLDGVNVGDMHVLTIRREYDWGQVTGPFVADTHVSKDHRRQGIGRALAAKMAEVYGGQEGWCGGFTEDGEPFWEEVYPLEPLPPRDSDSEFI